MGLIGGPQFSADGKLVAYAAIEKGPILDAVQIVYTQEVAVGAPPKLWVIGKTGAIHHVAELRWSPTAPLLAYSIINAQPHHHWLSVIDPGRGQRRELYDSAKHFLDFTWSPDGAVILVQGDDGDEWLYFRPDRAGPIGRVAPGGWRPGVVPLCAARLALRDRAVRIRWRAAAARGRSSPGSPRPYPDWGPTLEFSNPFELLVATILAAQAQDEHINQLTRVLFVKYRGPADYVWRAGGGARARRPRLRLLPDEGKGDPRRLGADARRVRRRGPRRHGLARPAPRCRSQDRIDRARERFWRARDRRRPPCRARRHPACASPGKGKARGTRIEEELRSLYPKKDWVKATWNLVLHGRRICTPTPKCPICPVIELCPYPKKTKVARTTRPAPRPRSAARRTR